MKKLILSKQGVHFTATSLQALRIMSEHDEKDGMYTILSIAVDENRQMYPAFGSNYEQHPLAIKDEVEGVVFEWWGDQPEFDQIREKYCVDAKRGRKTEFLDLSDIGEAIVFVNGKPQPFVQSKDDKE